MKAQVGVDSKTKLIDSAVATPANVADCTVLADLRHGEETRVGGDQGYRGQTEVIKQCALGAQDHTQRRYRYKNGIEEEERAKNRTKSSAVNGGARVSSDEAEIWFREAALPRAEEERPSAFVVCGLVNLFLSRRKLLLANRLMEGGSPRQLTKAINARGMGISISGITSKVLGLRDQELTYSESP